MSATAVGIFIAGPANAGESAIARVCAQEAQLPVTAAQPGKAWRAIDPGKALAACSQAHSEGPAGADVAANYGRALLAADRRDEARAILASAHGSRQARFNLAMMDFSIDRMSHAAETEGTRSAKESRGDRGQGGERAFAELRRLSGEGYAPAQLIVGRYLIGALGVIEESEQDAFSALELFRQAAESGSVEAKHWLAYLYHFGRGAPRDPVEAVRLYREAAESGFPPAMVAMGQILRDGSGVASDRAQGTAWLRRAAATGDDYAQFLLMQALEQDGESVPYALATLERLSEAGNTSAQVELADRLVTTKPDRASELYEKAAARGNLAAPFNPLAPTSGHRAALHITQAFQNLLNQVKIYPAVIGDAQLVFYGKKPSKAETDALIDRMTAKVGQLDVSIAKVMAAKKALVGRPMGLTPAEMLKAIRETAEGGDIGAAVLLAFPPDSLGLDLVSQQERDKWRDWLAKLDADRRNDLAAAMTDSIGGSQDFGLVLAGMTGPAEIDEDAYGEKARLQTLGKFHLFSLALDRVVSLVTSPKFTALPLAERTRLIRTLAEGLQSTCAWTASITAFVQQSRMLKEATSCNEQSPIFAATPDQLETLFSAGMTPAGLQLAYLYRSGELGDVDNARAAATLERVIESCGRREDELRAADGSEYYGTASSRCHAETRFAKIMLASLYEQGEGVAKDRQRADSLYRQGGASRQEAFRCATCTISSPVAAGGVLRSYVAGTDAAITQDQLVATASFAARSQDPTAMRSLAYLYWNGEGVGRNEAEAARWLQDAALQGDAEAQFALGLAYEKGVGVARDRKQAAQWLAVAARGGFRPKHPSAAAISALLSKASTDGPKVDLMARMAAIETIADRAFREGNFATNLEPQLDQAAEFHRLSGNADAMVATRLKALAVADAALIEKHGTMNNYFALLKSSCHWGRASLEAYRADRPEAALYFAKVSVNKLQQAREYIDQLDKNLRECFLKVHQDRYRWLADLLMEMGRYPEAEQVLGMLKDFEFREFTRASGGAQGDSRLEFSKAEAPTEYRRSALSDEIAKASKIAATIGAKKAGERSEAETAQLVAAKASLAQANTAYLAHFEALKAEVASLDRRADAADTAVTPDWQTGANRQIVATLRNSFPPETAALHAVLTPSRIHWLISTSNIQRAIAIDIGAGELQREVGQFRAALTGRSADAKARAAALYRRIFAPVDEELRKLGKTTVLLSLDGSLRYVPFAALSDGQDWLVKRYSFSSFRDVHYLRPDRKEPEDWQIAGFGVTREARVERTVFAPLPAVAQELEAIAGPNAGVAPGTVMLDDKFDRAALINALAREVPIVHLATHFKLAPDNDESMLLLGKNEGLKLTEFKAEGGFDLSNVDLLALSACETAIGARAASTAAGGGLDTNAGKELDGMGQIAQDAGAASVLASLWSVNDSSTAQLMRNFYINKIQKGLSKTAALRAVQLAFLDGAIKPSGGAGSRRPGIEAEGGPQAVSTDWDHPYYWAPFLLMGNVN